MKKLVVAALLALGITLGVAASQAQAGWWHHSYHYTSWRR